MDILNNVIGGFLVILLIVVIGWLINKITYRGILYKFFRIDKTKQISIYISNIRVNRFGSVGIDRKERSYSGATVPTEEYDGANRLSNMFISLFPNLPEKPGFLNDVAIKHIKTRIIPSPLVKNEINDESTIISLGSPAYNIVSNYIEDDCDSVCKFRLGVSRKKSRNKHTYKPTSFSTEATVSTYVRTIVSGTTASGVPDSYMTTSPSGIKIDSTAEAEISSAIIVKNKSEYTEASIGFIEKIFDNKHDRYSFYVAGLSELSTHGAAYYLNKKWKYIYKEYKYSSFYIILKFINNDYREFSVIDSGLI